MERSSRSVVDGWRRTQNASDHGLLRVARLGLGGFDYLDLDTPLLLSTDPVKGGYRYLGPQLLPWTAAGLGVESVSGPTLETDITTLE